MEEEALLNSFPLPPVGVTPFPYQKESVVFCFSEDATAFEEGYLGERMHVAEMSKLLVRILVKSRKMIIIEQVAGFRNRKKTTGRGTIKAALMPGITKVDSVVCEVEKGRRFSESIRELPTKRIQLRKKSFVRRAVKTAEIKGGVLICDAGEIAAEKDAVVMLR